MSVLAVAASALVVVTACSLVATEEVSDLCMTEPVPSDQPCTPSEPMPAARQVEQFLSRARDL